VDDQTSTDARPVVSSDDFRPGVASVDGSDEALLAAVHDEVIDYGVRRATATSIAKRAGVSRMTVYRRGGGVKQLVLDALSREFDTLLRQALVDAAAGSSATGRDATAALESRDAKGAHGIRAAAKSGTTDLGDGHGIPTTRHHLAAAIVLGARALAGSTLVHALLRHDPELLVPYLVDRHGHSQQAFVRYVEPVMAAGVADGSIRPGDPHVLATVVLHAVQGFVVSADILARELDEATLDAELARLVHGYLRPDVAELG
jgi:AcrR family transcriptional regulator